MKVFLVSMIALSVLLVILVTGVWLYTASILKREAALASHVLPDLELAQNFTTATAGLQWQGLLLGDAASTEQLTVRRQLLEDSISAIENIIHARSDSQTIDSSLLADSIDEMREVMIGLSNSRTMQLREVARLESDKDARKKVLDDLDSAVQRRVVDLTGHLLEQGEMLAHWESRGDLPGSKRESSYNATLHMFETNSLAVQDFLLFSQDLVRLKGVVERLPLLLTNADIAVAEQERDLLIRGLVKRAIYNSDEGSNEFLLVPLTQIRSLLRDEPNLFSGRRRVLELEETQRELSATLARLTSEVPQLTEQIRARAAMILGSISAQTRQGLDRYRWFLFVVLSTWLLVLSLLSYWLLYRRTALPLISITRQLDTVGTDQFEPAAGHYFISEMQELANAVAELDQIQKAMQTKDHALSAANEELRRANEELEQFAHIASHDLQEPLRKLQQFSGLLEEDYASVLDEDGKFYLQAIANSARRMSAMIRDTLEYARSGQQNQSLVTIDLAQLISSQCEELDLSVGHPNACVTLDELPGVQANATGLSQLFRNLLANAEKYQRPDCPLQVHIDAHDPEDDAAVVIRVRDNGIGIEHKYQQRVFRPFERLNTGSVAGTGLGLAICSKVCHAHGWSIDLKSEVGVGSCFHIRIPRDDVAK